MYKLTAEGLRILKELDVDSALKVVAADGFIPDTREIALAGLHKARLIHKKPFTKKELKASREWLIDNNYEVPK